MRSYLHAQGHRLDEQLMEAHFGNHPLSMSVLGSSDSIAKLQQPQMADYFKNRYGPGNMVLVATGKLDFDEIVRLAERYMGSWPRVNAPRLQPEPLYKPQ